VSSFLSTTVLVQEVSARGCAHKYIQFSFKTCIVKKNKTRMFLYEKIEVNFGFLFYCFNVFKAVRLCFFLVTLEAVFSEHNISVNVLPLCYL
jgi:hypothetical protein